MKTSPQKRAQRFAILGGGLLLIAGLAAFYANRIPATVPPKPYQVGQVTREKLVAPKKFSVVDPVQTDALRQVELAKAPFLFRFQNKAADQVVARFSTEFFFARENFLDAVEKNFKMRKLTTNQIAMSRFRKMVTTFRSVNHPFPVDLGQASHWAVGGSSEEFQKILRAELQQIVTQHIRPDDLVLPPRSNHLKIVNAELSGTPAELLQHSKILRRTNVVTVSKARMELQNRFPRDERAFANALTNFIVANIFFDETLTAQVRAEKIKDVWAIVTFAPGQLIVEQGKPIDALAKAALDELKIFTPVAGSTAFGRTAFFVSAIVCATFGIGLWMVAVVLRRRSRILATNVVVLPRAENFGNELHTKLMPHLARGLMSKLVRGLISQRADLLDAQTSGTQQLNELEEKLELVTTRLQLRQAAYEKRIAELERELAATEEENRELIRAKIREARQNLEWAKAQNQ